MQHIKIDGVEYKVTVTPNGNVVTLWAAEQPGQPEVWWGIDRHGVELPGENINHPAAFKRACVAWLQSGQYGGMTLQEFLEATNETKT